MKHLPTILAFLLVACVPLEEETNMADLGPYRETVGIRQVTHNGVKLESAMRLEITGGEIETITAADGVKTYKLTMITEAQWGIKPEVVAIGAYAASMGEFVRVNNPGLGFGDIITITLPTPTANDVGRSVSIRDLDDAHAGAVKVDAGAFTIKPSGVSLYTFVGAGNGRTFVWDGTYWVAEGAI